MQSGNTQISSTLVSFQFDRSKTEYLVVLVNKAASNLDI